MKTISLLVLAGTLALAGCGDDSSSDTTTTTAAAKTTTTMAKSETTTTMTMTSSTKNIVETAQAAGNFTVLIAAAQAAGLAEALQAPGPITVFAPTDEAFAAALTKLNITKEALLADKAKLADILKYHVVSGKVMAADAVKLDGKKADTLLAGKQLSVKVDGSTVMINDAKVVKADIAASNGVIHVIDSVLLPA